MKSLWKYAVIAAAAVLAAASVAVAASASFDDVADDHPQRNDIEYAVAQGWFQGYGDGTFKPDRAITQRQIVTVIGRAFPEGSTRADLATFLRGGSDRLTAVPDPVPTRTAGPVATLPNGTYSVGTQIEPGRYAFYASGSCYWERLSGFTGGFEDINANDNVSGYFVVDILPGDAGFKLNCHREGGARKVTGYSDVGEVLTPSSSAVPSGVYRVGADITTGRYQLNGSCYWARLSGFSGEFSDIIANDNTDGPFIVEILATDIGFEITCR